MTLSIVTELHEFVAQEHCRACRASYMRKYRATHNQKQYAKKFAKWTEQDRIENRKRIEWLKRNGVHLRIIERQIDETDSIFEVGYHPILVTEPTCWVCLKARKLVRSFTRTVKIPRTVIRIPFNGPMTDHIYSRKTGRKVPNAELEKCFDLWLKGKGYWISITKQVEHYRYVQEYGIDVCPNFTKGCVCLRCTEKKVVKLDVPIINEGDYVTPATETFVPYNVNKTNFSRTFLSEEPDLFESDEVEVFPLCNHDWAYEKKRIRQLASDFVPLCECSFKVKKRIHFDCFEKQFGICKRCLEIVQN